MSWVGEILLNLNNWWYGVARIKSTLQKNPDALRVGILAAAAINYQAFIDPTQTHPDTVLVAIAARSKAKAEAQIAKYGLTSSCKAYGSYDELLADPSIDAVYIPTPNSLHAMWAIKAMEAGKHVLIEKPIAANAHETRQIRETSRRTGKVAVEACHWRFHPAAHLCKSIIESGKYGQVKEIYSRLNILQGMFGKDDIRWEYKLGAGACMDLMYVFSACSYYAATDSTRYDSRVLEATAELHEKDKLVDKAMYSRFVIEQEGRPPVNCMIEGDLALQGLFGFIPRLSRLSAVLAIQLEKAEVQFDNFLGAALGHAITITEKDDQGRLTGKKHVEKCYVNGPLWETRGQPWWSNYRYQLEAFVDMVRATELGKDYQGPWVNLEETERMMELIEKVYEKAGLPKRGL